MEQLFESIKQIKPNGVLRKTIKWVGLLNPLSYEPRIVERLLII